MPRWQARVYVRRVRAVHFLAQEWAEVKRRIPASWASAHQPGPSAAQAPPLHLIPLVPPNLRRRRRTSLPYYAAGDATLTSQTDFWCIQLVLPSLLVSHAHSRMLSITWTIPSYTLPYRERSEWAARSSLLDPGKLTNLQNWRCALGLKETKHTLLK